MSDLLTRMLEAAERDNGGPLTEAQRRFVEQAARDTEAACAMGRAFGRLLNNVVPR